MLGVAATALFFGDAIITPAMSVLSAVEGLSTVSDTFTVMVLPISILILIGLFAIQSYGTAKVGTLFGPIIIFYFLVLAMLGVRSIVTHPAILGTGRPLFDDDLPIDLDLLEHETFDQGVTLHRYAIRHESGA